MILARLLSATPQTDGEHWDLQFRWHYDAWHTDAYGQNPTPYQRGPQTGQPNRIPYPWQANRSAWLVDDALFPGQKTVGLYTAPGQLTIAGMPPIDQASVKTSAPQVPLQATSGGGGTIAAGSYVLAVVSVDSDGRKSQPSHLISAVVAAGSSTITIPNLVFDSGAAGYEIYFGPHSLKMWQVATGSPASSITIGGSALPTAGMGRPDVVFNSFRVIITPIRHGGIWGSGASTIATHAITIPSSPTTNQWAGRILSLYGSATLVGGSGPFSSLCYAKPANFSVTANNTAGVMTVTQSTLLSGVPFTYSGDAYVMRAQANIASANTIGDSAFVNQFAPAGLVVNGEVGKVVWITKGTGAGQRRNIASNTATTCTITSTWDIIPDATSTFVILESAPSLTIETAAFNTDGLSISDAILAATAVPFSSKGSQSFLVQVVTEDAAGNISPSYLAPWQEVFIPAQPSSSLPDGYWPTFTPVAGVATIDLKDGLNQVLVLNATPVTMAAPIFSTGTLGDGSWFTVYFRQDATGNRPLPTFTNAAGAFCDNVAAVIQYSPDGGTDTPVTFTLRGGFWIPDLPGAHSS